MCLFCLLGRISKVSLFSNDPSTAMLKNAKKYAEKQLDRLGLQLHPKKAQIVRSSPEVVFLGEPLPNPNR